MPGRRLEEVAEQDASHDQSRSSDRRQRRALRWSRNKNRGSRDHLGTFDNPHWERMATAQDASNAIWNQARELAQPCHERAIFNDHAADRNKGHKDHHAAAFDLNFRRELYAPTELFGGHPAHGGIELARERGLFVEKLVLELWVVNDSAKDGDNAVEFKLTRHRANLHLRGPIHKTRRGLGIALRCLERRNFPQRAPLA
jgi:hypothetical protein